MKIKNTKEAKIRGHLEEQRRAQQPQSQGRQQNPQQGNDKDDTTEL